MSTEEKNVRLPWFGFPKILPYMKPYQKTIIAMIFLGIIASLIDSIYPLFNAYALNHFIALQTTDTMTAFIILFLALLAFQVWINYLSVYWCGLCEMKIDQDLRNASFRHLQTLSFSYFNQNNVGYIHARVMSDTAKIGEMASWRLMDLVWNISYLIFMVIVMFRTNVRLSLGVIALMPIIILITLFFQNRLIRYNRDIREANSRITSDFNEGITGIRSIKTLVIEPGMNKDFRRDTGLMYDTSLKAGRCSGAFHSLYSLLSSTVLALVLWRGGLLTQQGLMNFGTLSIFMTYALQMIDPLQRIVATIAQLIAIQVNIERFCRLMDTRSDVADSPEVVARYGDTFHPKKENWEPLYGTIDFEDVSFHYPDGEEMVLEHFSLHVPQGTNIAIVGETGAGKSTLVNLVCRFYEPTSGRILIDGVDARQRSQLWLHSHIGYVLQSPHLFSGTVRQNLRYGRPEATDEEILQALKLVHADFVLEKMDKGLDSEVGEGGDLLSTGEKQLLCFARAILADPSILILDEATASIDTMTEKAIQDAIATVIRGRTSFVIAHRLSTIVDADEILVVRDGKIVERGRHAQLMQKGGYYYRLYTQQYGDLLIDQIRA